MTNPTVLNKKTKGALVILAVYVHDIILIGSDDTSILTTNTYLQQLTNRDREVIENKRLRVKIKTKLTNLKKLTRNEGYRGE